jgi:pimeloyl-ACP methyl ester carboxylesterase
LAAGGGGSGDDDMAEGELRELEGIQIEAPAAEASGDERLYAHAGMMASARAIVADLDALGLLGRISREQPGWELMVVGHSLGGAVAALVAWLLRCAQHPQVVRCWAIDPPGMTCSPALAKRMELFCTSVTYGSSWVSRFTGFVALRKYVFGPTRYL